MKETLGIYFSIIATVVFIAAVVITFSAFINNQARIDEFVVSVCLLEDNAIQDLENSILKGDSETKDKYFASYGESVIMGCYEEIIIKLQYTKQHISEYIYTGNTQNTCHCHH